ncbi:Serpin-Z2 [Bienertia sinuspersici]
MQIAKSSKRNENPVICNFNAVLVKQSYSLNKYHQDFVENVFNAKVKSVDFLHKDAVAEVNAWAEIETKGCINQLIPYKNFNKLTMLVRANGLYFSGMWANEFIESNTENEKFHLIDGEKTVDVPFMKDYECYYHHASFDDYDVLSIPYKFTNYKNSRAFSMIIMLPKDKVGLPKLIKKFRENTHLLSRKHLNMSHKMITQLWIPRFKFEYGLFLQMR